MGNHLIYHGQSPPLDDSPTHGWEPYSLNNTLSFDIIHNIQNAFEDTAKQLQATGARRGVLRMQQGDWVDDVLNDGKHDGVHGVYKRHQERAMEPQKQFIISDHLATRSIQG